MELKFEYEVSRDYFWPKKKQEWKTFLRNPWRYWRSYLLKKKIAQRFADQIRKDIDREILLSLNSVSDPVGDINTKPITGIVNHELL